MVPYLTLMTPEAPKRHYDLREAFNALRWIGAGPASRPAAIAERRSTAMASYVILTRLSPDAIPGSGAIDRLGQAVIDKLNAEVPEAK